MRKSFTFATLVICALTYSAKVFATDTITVALTAKAFQYTVLPIAQDRGYMKEERHRSETHLHASIA